MSSEFAPSAKWLSDFEKHKDALQSPVDYCDFFAQKTIDDATMHRVRLGKVHFPSGRFFVADPLMELSDPDTKPYLQPIPKGSHECVLFVADFGNGHYRHAAFSVIVSDKTPCVWTQGLCGDENFDDLDDDDSWGYFGFGVDTGLAAIGDEAARRAFAQFEEQWYAKNPDGNIYSDYFDALFAQSLKDDPVCHMRGDRLLFNVPDTDLNIAMIASGWGDGYYPVYLGYDAAGNVCQIVVDFLLFYEEDDESDDE